MRGLFLISLLLLFGLSGGALADEPQRLGARVELEARDVDDAVVIPAGEQGVVLLTAHDGGRQFVLTLRDPALQEVWSIAHRFDERMDIQGWHATEGAIWVLAHRGREAQFTLLRAGLADGDLRVSQHQGPDETLGEIHDLIVQGEDAWLIAHKGAWSPIQGSQGTFLHVDPQGQVRALPVAESFGERKIWVQRLAEDPVSGRLEVTAATWKGKRRILHLASVEGDRLVDVRHLGPDPAHNLQSAQRIHLASGREVLIGTYGHGPKSRGSQGLFMADVIDGVVQPSRRWDFTELAHFFDHLSLRRQDNIARKARAKAEEGDSLALSYNLQVHDLFEVEGQLILVAEAFVPEYATRTETKTVVVNGVTQTQTTTYRVFEGWRFTHAIVVGFTPDGVLAWDASVPIGDILSPTIRPHVSASVEGQRVTLVYPARGRLSRRVFENGAEVEALARGRVETESGQVIGGRDEFSEHWFGSRFLLWGIQVVKDDEGRRRVFALTVLDADTDTDTDADTPEEAPTR